MRRSTVFVGLITCVIGACLFQLKYEVMRLESQYKNICHTIQSSEQSISILKAEWAHLTNPQRLQQLAQKHLGIQALTQKQVVSFRRGGLAVLPPEGAAQTAASRITQEKTTGFQSATHVTASEGHSLPEVPIAVESRPLSAKKESGRDDLEKILDEVHERPSIKSVNKSAKPSKVDEDAMDSLISELSRESDLLKSGRKRS